MYRLNFNHYSNIIKNYSNNNHLLYSTYSNKQPKPPNNDLLICAIFCGLYFIYKKI